MATVDQIASLRLLVAQPDDAEPYTDAALSGRIDADGDINKTAYSIWVEKAAARADLADISEGGSSRKQGDLYEQALNMSKHFADLIEIGPPAAGGPGLRISRLRR
jgi:hypothetical protein